MKKGLSDLLVEQKNEACNSRTFYSRSSSFNAYGAHLVASTIRVGSSPVKSPLFNALSKLITGFGADFFLSKAAASWAIVSINPNLEDCPTVIALPLPQKPLLPGFCMPIFVKDPKVLAALEKGRRRGAPYAGAFLLKNEAPSSILFSAMSFLARLMRLRKNKSENIVQKLQKLKGKEPLKLIHQVGTLSQISSIQGDKVILVGLRRLRITELVSKEPLTVRVEHLKDKPYDKDDDAIKTTFLQVNWTLRNVLKITSLWRDQVQTYTQPIGDFNYQHLADFVAGISGANKHQNQEVLEEMDVKKRLEMTLELVKKQVEINKIQVLSSVPNQKLRGKTNDKYSQSGDFRGRINANKDKIPKRVLKVIEKELIKLKMSWFTMASKEYEVIHNYLDWLTLLPWGNFSDENFDVVRAKKILDEDHYGLPDVKERILEFIAVGKLRGTSQGKIICLSGPPGVGKTSIGRSIARALDRKFFRFSVGGLHDVAEIKGHRRTYIGASPGKLVQCLKSVGTQNPLVLIDEIDKMGKSNFGDPASALLEVLDPEQNTKFLDHYLDVPIDLSKVLFVCTANEMNKISGPLLDRMEVITLPGYVTDEKMHIARDYLMKTTCRDCGIKPEQAVVNDAVLLSLIENYCREPGVRNLKMQIEKIYRKIALKLVREGAIDVNDTKSLAKTDLEVKRMTFMTNIMKLLKAGVRNLKKQTEKIYRKIALNLVRAEAPIVEVDVSDTKSLATTNSEVKRMTVADIMKLLESAIKKVVIEESNLADYVGKPAFFAEKIYEQTPVGVAMCLAWTSVGGSTLFIETTFVEKGKDKGGLHKTTGQLGDVMKESAVIAYTVARGIMLEKEPENSFFANSKLHLHVPRGATPKDGPSAGCTMVTSLLSLAMKKPVRKDLAMTGEVTLTGRILRIGGVREKTIAARRSQLKMIIFPEGNRRDFDELGQNVKEGLDVHFVREYEDIFELAFGYDH